MLPSVIGASQRLALDLRQGLFNVEARELDVWPRSCARPCVWDIAALIVHGCAYKERDLAKILVVMAITYNVM
jgi:hypothetical protein